MAERVLQGRFQISTVNDVTPGSEWQCVGVFADNYAKFTAPNVETVFNAGDTVYIYVMSPTYGNVDRFRVTAVNSATVTNDLDVNVVYDEDTPMANPVGRPLPGNTLIAKASENGATMTPVMISASLDERLYNYARNLNDNEGGGTPSDTVTPETTFGQSSNAGTSEDYSRADHTHGTPAAPSVPNPADTVTTELAFGQISGAGSAVTYSRSDHTHGTPTIDATDISGAAGDNVTAETTFGQPSNPGTDNEYSRRDHTHGTPVLDSNALATIAGGNTVTSETSFGQSSNAGTATEYSRADHTHGTPVTPVTTLNSLTGGLSITAGSGISVTPSGSDIEISSTGGGGGLVQYVVNATSGEELSVLATDTGITYSRAGNVGTFTVPVGVRLVSFKARIPYGAKVGNSFTFDIGNSVMGNNNITDRWIPHYIACDENTGSSLYSTLLMDMSNFSRFTIQGLSASTDIIVCGF